MQHKETFGVASDLSHQCEYSVSGLKVNLIENRDDMV